MGFFLIVLSTFMWALDTLIRYPLMAQGMEASRLVFFEHLLLTFFLFPFGWRVFQKIKEKSFSGMGSFLVIGVLGSALSTLAFTKAFSLINPSVVILLQKFQPVVAIFLAHLILRERIKGEFLFFAFICLLGAFLMSYQEVISSVHYLGQWGEGLGKSPLTERHFYGLLLTLLAVMGWGASTVFGKRLWTLNYREGEIMLGRFIIGLLAVIPFILSKGHGGIQNIVGIKGSAFSQIFFMVMISGVMGMGLYYKGLRKTSARQAALAEMFFPLFALALNWFFLSATLNPIQMVGGGLLLLGSTIIQFKNY